MKNTKSKREFSLKANEANKLKAEEGIVIYLALITLSAALATALFVAGVFVKEFKISRDLVSSLRAVYVADTAMEYTLYQVRNATYNETLQSITVGAVTLLASNTTTTSILPAGTACASTLALPGNALCSADAQIILLGSKPGCPSGSSAPNCVDVVTRGSSGGSNRAIEIVYENL